MGSKEQTEKILRSFSETGNYKECGIALLQKIIGDDFTDSDYNYTPEAFTKKELKKKEEKILL